MIRFRGQRILLDIEGTVSDIQFVRQVLFPYARREVASFLTRHLTTPEVQSALHQMARDGGASDWENRVVPDLQSPEAIDAICQTVHRWIDSDSKQTGLKSLQGMIWEAGYRDGTLRAPLFPDVPAALTRWREAGLSLAIYSSGSIAAQKLFFGHTTVGDMTPLFSQYFDTTSGPKRSVDSYRQIARSSGLAPERILFLSDIPDELDAARAAGFATGCVVRPGNAAVDNPTHAVVNHFDEIEAVSDAESAA